MNRLIVCFPGNHFSRESRISFKNLIYYCQDKRNGIDLPKENIIVEWYPGNCYYVRSKCLKGSTVKGKEQKPFQGAIDYDYIFWVDSDIIFEPEMVSRLLSHETDIVSGWYVGPQDNVVAGDNWDLDHYVRKGYFPPFSKKYVMDKKTLFPCVWTGLGFTLVKRGVFEKMEYPWFRPVWPDLGDKVQEFSSEDVGFSIMAQELDYELLIDPRCHPGHEKTKIFY